MSGSICRGPLRCESYPLMDRLQAFDRARLLFVSIFTISIFCTSASA
jgi:hypothetical protein